MHLKHRIIEEIRVQGPMPFERFMEIALYDPEGFFGGDELRSEKSGDFLTSPEVSTLFGETLATYVTGIRDRIGDPFQVVEVAAGSGSLLRPMMETIDVEALAVEAAPAARNRLADMVPVAEEMPPTLRGVVIANELLDNLPMAVAQKVDGRWRERWVGLDAADLVFVDADPRDEVLDWLDSYAGEVPDGGWVEVQLAARSWVADAIDRLEAGAVLLIRRHRRESAAETSGRDAADLPGPSSGATPARRAREDRHHGRRQLHRADGPSSQRQAGPTGRFSR